MGRKRRVCFCVKFDKAHCDFLSENRVDHEIFKIADLEKHAINLGRSAFGVDLFVDAITCSTGMQWFNFSLASGCKSLLHLGFAHEYFALTSGLTLLSDDYAFAGILIKFIKSSVRDFDNFIYGLKRRIMYCKIYAGSVQN